jgi:CheY-like chemotaxis protein
MEIRKAPPTANIPVVAVTAFHSANVAQQAIRSGFNAYFPKPIETTSFVRELERIVDAN